MPQSDSASDITHDAALYNARLKVRPSGVCALARGGLGDQNDCAEETLLEFPHTIERAALLDEVLPERVEAAVGEVFAAVVEECREPTSIIVV